MSAGNSYPAFAKDAQQCTVPPDMGARLCMAGPFAQPSRNEQPHNGYINPGRQELQCPSRLPSELWGRVLEHACGIEDVWAVTSTCWDAYTARHCPMHLAAWLHNMHGDKALSLAWHKLPLARPAGGMEPMLQHLRCQLPSIPKCGQEALSCDQGTGSSAVNAADVHAGHMLYRPGTEQLTNHGHMAVTAHGVRSGFAKPQCTGLQQAGAQGKQHHTDGVIVNMPVGSRRQCLPRPTAHAVMALLLQRNSHGMVSRAPCVVSHRCIKQAHSPRPLLLCTAAAADSAAVQLLLQHGADPNVRDKNGSALHAAVSGCAQSCDRAVEVIRLLLRAGACVNAPSACGATPLHHAVAAGALAVVKVLLAAGADPNARIPRYGATPLHYACSAGSGAAVQMLLMHGADVCALNAMGATPLQVAVRDGHMHLRVLLDHADA